MLDLSDKKLKVKIGENSYNLSYPSVAQFESYSDDLKKIDQDDPKKMNEMMFKFLDDLGLPVEIGRSLQQANLTTLLNELAGTKKK